MRLTQSYTLTAGTIWLCLVSISSALATQPASVTVSENVPIDENLDRRTTISFDPSSNYMPVSHGTVLMERNLSPFGASIVQSRYANGVVTKVTVQGCGDAFAADTTTRCYIASGDLNRWPERFSRTLPTMC